MKMKKGRITLLKVKLEDVAREAEVSIATVSRVLNNHPVSEKARLAVEEAIAHLDYRPNLMARGLIKGQSYRIGVIVSNMENPYFSSIMNSMEIRLREEGYLCNFASSYYSPKEDELDIVKRFMDSGVDGLIIVDVGEREENSGLYSDLNKQLPVVLINGKPDRTDTNLIMVDQEKGMIEVMNYLFSLNHTDIALIRGSANSMSFNCKETILRSKMKEQGIPVKENRIIHIKDTDHFDAIDETCNNVISILDTPDKPTAVFASNELMALGVIKACKKLGVSIPEDLSLVAHDNTILSQISEPAMTTVDMNTSRLGIESAEMMLQLLNSKNPSPRRLIFYPELIIRESCSEI
jgi:LacI family transcriptional regulator, galactose operon repressor